MGYPEYGFSDVAWSRRNPPLYVGSTPLELVNGVKASTRRLPLYMEKQVGNFTQQAFHQVSQDGITSVEMEIWPAYDGDTGCFTWAIGRWRPKASAGWFFFNQSTATSFADAPSSIGLPPPVLNCLPTFPSVLRPWVPAERAYIVNPAVELPGLYDQPSFQNCVWSSADGTSFRQPDWPNSWLLKNDTVRTMSIVDRWNGMPSTPPSRRIVCRVLPQPARFNGVPETYTITVSASSAVPQFPVQMEWLPAPLPVDVPECPVGTNPNPSAVDHWTNDAVPKGPHWQAAWLKLIEQLVQFQQKSAGDPSNRLFAVRSFLRQQYRRLGLQTSEIKASSYQNISDFNLFVRFPGTDAHAAPVILVDHYDTAFEEDTFAATGQRVSNPGADDNGSATATLVMAAQLLVSLQRQQLRRPVLLVHLTGEEFPADDLGARHLIDYLFNNNSSNNTNTNATVIVMDMISWRASADDPVFQISAGISKESVVLAKCVMAACQQLQQHELLFTRLEPLLLPRFDKQSWLYNTDGVVFSDAGFTSVLINEHLNRFHNFNRPCYHKSCDLPGTLDVNYGTSVARVAIQTLLHVAS